MANTPTTPDTPINVFHAHEVKYKLALDKLSSTEVKSTTPHTQGEANE
jgi:hypothetical protein